MLQALLSKKWIWIAGGFVLLAGIAPGGLALLGHRASRAGTRCEDPQRRFSMRIDPSWELVETDGD
jgi:hypothetical protein